MIAPTRFAAVDVGSNTVKLIIVDRGEDGALVPVLEISRASRLGEGIHLNRLREAAMRRTLDALAEFRDECSRLSVEGIAAVGTSALRDAVNRDEFVERSRELGLGVEPIAGEEEARLSFAAVRRDPLWRDARDLAVIDIGGGSTEVILGGADGVRSRISLKLGAVRLTEAWLRSDPPTVVQIQAANQSCAETLSATTRAPEGAVLVAVGGTATNMAAVRLAAQSVAPAPVHGSLLTLDDIEDQKALFGARSVAERRMIPGLDPARADVILGGALILGAAAARLGAPSVSVSSRGLRWGVLYDRFGA